MAIMAFTRLGPRTATNTIVRRKYGKASKRSVARMITASSAPP